MNENEFKNKLIYSEKRQNITIINISTKTTIWENYKLVASLIFILISCKLVKCVSLVPPQSATKTRIATSNHLVNDFRTRPQQAFIRHTTIFTLETHNPQPKPL